MTIAVRVEQVGHEQRGATKVYKVTLQNGDKRIRVKTNDKGEFI